MMKKNNNDEYITPEGFKLRPYKEEMEEVSLKIPAETMAVLKKVADSRDLPVGALLRFFIGQGLRVELAENFPELQRELFERRFKKRKKNDAVPEEIDLAA